MRHPYRRLAAAALTGALLTGATAGAASSPSGQVALVAYSIPAPAYAALIKAFNKTAAGRNVSVVTSFGASGSQSKAVAAGLPADVVQFSLDTDVERLVSKGLVAPNWNKNATNGHVTDSVVVFVVPKGNPQHIQTWGDLVSKRLRIFTPNPFSSGAARWNLMAAYGAELKLHKTPEQAQQYLRTLLSRTVVQGASGAAETQAFVEDMAANKNDVLLDYEDDAIQAIRAGQKVSYIVPPQSILIENPIAVTTNASNPAAARAFVQYLLSPAGQTEWTRLGYRSVLPKVEAGVRTKYPVRGLFSIGSLGGWDTIATTFFGTGSNPGIVTKIEQTLGASTASS